MKRTIRERNILFLCEANACLSQMAETAGRDAVDRRVFALFLDYWRNVA